MIRREIGHVVIHQGDRGAFAEDQGHVTEYSQTNAQEDFAETGLMIYTYLCDPDRLPANVRSAMQRTIPSRIAFWRSLFPETGKEFFTVACMVSVKVAVAII